MALAEPQTRRGGYAPRGLPACGVALHAARVGAGVEEPPAPRDPADPAEGPRRQHDDLVPAAANVGEHGAGGTRLGRPAPRPGPARAQLRPVTVRARDGRRALR